MRSIEPGISRYKLDLGAQLRTVFVASHRPGMTVEHLTSGGRGLIAAPMTIAATMTIARRRRIIAVWADVCV